MGEKSKIDDQLVHLARIALQGDQRQTEAFIRLLIRQNKKVDPELTSQLTSLLTTGRHGSVMDATRKSATSFVPVDGETRLDLIRIEYPDELVEEPMLLGPVQERVGQILTERQNLTVLANAGLEPSRTILFTGPPGVGKTLTARWVARELRQPLLTLDLSSVMSSFLGRTGANLRSVLDYAKRTQGVLFLDEFDAVAKRRGDDTEVGELKRLVTVLLQEIDHWPSDQLLIAATNHGELLDPAVWRRFDVIVDFPFPTSAALISVSEKELAGSVGPGWAKAFAIAMTGHSFSDLVRLIRSVRRHAVVYGQSIEERLLLVIRQSISSLNKAGLKSIALELESAGVAQRQISDITGLSRDTIRKARGEREIGHG